MDYCDQHMSTYNLSIDRNTILQFVIYNAGKIKHIYRYIGFLGYWHYTAYCGDYIELLAVVNIDNCVN